MNGRKSKKLRKRAKQLLVDWLCSIIPDEEDSKVITVDNVDDYLSDQTHVYTNRKLLLSAYSFKWMYKRVKRNPELTLEQLEKDMKKEEKKLSDGTGGIF